MSLSRGNWSSLELARLRELYPHTERSRLARILGRSETSIRRQARRLFGGQVSDGPWSTEDDLGLRRAWGVLSVSEIAMVLGRGEEEVRSRVEQLRPQSLALPRAWTRRETALLKELYGTRSDGDLEVCLSRPAAEIRERAQILCLAKDKAWSDGGRRRMPRWTRAETDRLMELYPQSSNLAIARDLGRSVTSVANKASQLGLKKSPGCLERMGKTNVAVRYRG